MGQYSPPDNDSADFGVLSTSYAAPDNDTADIQARAFAPDAPTNVRISDATSEDELTLDWDEVSNASSYNVYRAQSSGSVKSDYTLVAEPTSPPYTDTNLEDGERYYYRVSSEN